MFVPGNAEGGATQGPRFFVPGTAAASQVTSRCLGTHAALCASGASVPNNRSNLLCPSVLPQGGASSRFAGFSTRRQSAHQAAANGGAAEQDLEGDGLLSPSKRSRVDAVSASQVAIVVGCSLMLPVCQYPKTEPSLTDLGSGCQIVSVTGERSEC